jgi:Paf1
VGPCFVGNSLDGVLVERSRQYKAANAVEVNYEWKLHSEPDLGVPLAPSAMDVKSYKAPPKQDQEDESMRKSKKLHPDDEALLEWKGPLGDTAAENLKKRQDQLRAAARLALAEGRGRIPNVLLPANMEQLTSPGAAAAASVTSKKAFSRVLDESMQTWMKKTTYLSNDYSRKVHDFKSLATTKQQVEKDLESKKQQMSVRRSAQAIAHSFTSVDMPPVHPSKKHLKPKTIMPVLPNTEHWGYSYTHVVIDKALNNVDLNNNDLERAFVAQVEQNKNNRMICQLWAPPPPKGDSDSEDDNDDNKSEEDENKDPPGTLRYHPIQEFDLDVIPLKEEDQPHVNFCLWVDPQKNVTTYLPISSRVQLSTGRPVKRSTLRRVARRADADADLEEILERQAEVDYDIAQKIGATTSTAAGRRASTNSQSFITSNVDKKDDGDDDFGDDDDSDDSVGEKGKDKKPATSAVNNDDDSDEEEMFGGLKTIIAEN